MNIECISMYLAESWVNVYRYQNGKVKLKKMVTNYDYTKSKSVISKDVNEETDKVVQHFKDATRGIMTGLTDPDALYTLEHVLEYLTVTRFSNRGLHELVGQLEAELELCKPLQPSDERVSDFSEQSDGLIASIVSMDFDASNAMCSKSRIDILTKCIISMNEHIKTLRNHSNDLEDRLSNVAKILKCE